MVFCNQLLDKQKLDSIFYAEYWVIANILSVNLKEIVIYINKRCLMIYVLQFFCTAITLINPIFGVHNPQES